MFRFTGVLWDYSQKQPHKLGVRRLKSEIVKVSSSRSHSVTFLKVAVVPRVKRDLTVFDFRMYLNPDRTKTGDFVGLLLVVVFGPTHLVHLSLASINRLNILNKNKVTFIQV